MHFSKNKICCISDFHFGVHQDNSIWHNISLNFIKDLKQKLINMNIKDIVICGDVNNDRNEISLNTMFIINKAFKMLKDFNIFILVGNHDAYYRDRSDINSLSLLDGWDNINVYDTITTINEFDQTITFCPWATELEKIPKSDVLFGHFGITGFKMSKGKICAEGLNSYDILGKSSLIISGHFHLREERKYKDGTILYLGSPYELNWGESGGKKGFYILDLISKTYEFIENTNSPKHKKIRLSELIATKKLTRDIRKEFPGNFISFIVDHDVDLDKIDMLINKLSMLKPLSIKTEFDLENKYNIDDLNYEFTGVDIPAAIEEFINMLEVENKKDILNITLELYKQST